MNLFQNLISVSNVIYSSFFLPHFTCRRFVYFIALISKPIFHFFFEGRPIAFIWSFFPISLIFAFNFLLFTLFGLFCYAFFL